MKTMNVFVMVAVVASMVIGCVSASVQEDACDSHSFSFPIPSDITGYPVGDLGWGPLTLPAIDAPPQSIDFSGTLSKLTDVSDSLSASISSLTVANHNGELSWVKGISVFVTGSNPDQSKALFATYTGPSDASELNVKVVMSSKTVLQYLEAGPVSLTVQIDSSTVDTNTVKMLYGLHGSLSSGVNACVLVNGSTSKSL
jgi:hypothetical protein